MHIPGLRWVIIATCFLTTALNYLDRQCLSVAASSISREFHFSNRDYSTIVTSFLVAYTIMQLVSGGIVDRLGVRKGMALFLSWWSISTLLHAVSTGLWSFRLFRFMLGMGEAGNWPASTKAVSEWFPSRERALAVAIFDSGSSLGGLIAPPLVAWLMIVSSWRAAFWVTGALGGLLLILWLSVYRHPAIHPLITVQEREEILADRRRQNVINSNRTPLSIILRVRQTWGVVLGRFLTDCVWWFYVYWLPKYLADQRGFSLVKIAAVAWIPFVAMDVGNLVGGWLSTTLIRIGWSLNSSRKLVLRLGAAGICAGLPAGLTSDAFACIGFICLATFAYGLWGTIMLTLPTDLFPSADVGLVSGLSGTGAGLGGITLTWAIGMMLDHFSYKPVFVLAALLPVVALIVVQSLIPHVAYLTCNSRNNMQTT